MSHNVQIPPLFILAKVLYNYTALVTRVVDGDTVVVDIDLGCKVWLHDEHVRLHGIDAPEPHTETRDAGLASKEILRSIVEGKQVFLETFSISRGKYGRYSAIIWHEGMNVNDWLVENGYAVLSEG